MDKHIVFETKGVCSKAIEFDIVDGYVHNIKFDGGCRGNTQGVAILAEGMEAEDIITRLKGIDCNNGNSCPNQLAIAVEQAVNDK